uniref:Carboxylic ester hydrolase n=1 Tax=Parastrongyloides trichosuri TaxID=131310 RepID=A0A0N4ZAR0_PARTI
DINGTEITEFLGVPYAAPQTSDRRFLPPVPINESTFKSGTYYRVENDSYQAFTLANSCPQFFWRTGFIGTDMLIPTNNVTEDCLQLNMWVPDKNISNDKNMSTIIFLHGGSFATGSGSLDIYNGSILATKENVIVITLNYRVGPLGFAYFGEDTDAKGNAGLLDQQEGLKWIYENIKYFGGNSSNITLFGSSAGAASATAHLFSNNSHNYFGKLIANSGAITNVWATVPQKVALNNTLWLASLVNCTINMTLTSLSTENKTKIINCMQEANTTILNSEQFTTRDVEQPPFPYTFLPMYNDTVFFKGDLFDKLRNGHFKKRISSMYGRTSHEGTLFMPFMLTEKYGCGYNFSKPSNDTENKCLGITSLTVFASWFELGKYYKATLTEEIKLGLKYLDVQSGWPFNNILFMLKKFKKVPGKRNRDKMIVAISDFLFNCDNAHFAEKSSANNMSLTYYFEFRKNSTVNPWPQWMNPMHGYELEYVFGMPYLNSSIYNGTILDEEKKYAEKIMKYYGNFAKLGYPDTNWHPYKPINTTKSNNTNCAILDRDLTKTNHQLKYRSLLTDKCELLNNVAQSHPPRCPPTKSLFDYVYGFISNGWSYINPENLRNQIMEKLKSLTGQDEGNLEEEEEENEE